MRYKDQPKAAPYTNCLISENFIYYKFCSSVCGSKTSQLTSSHLLTRSALELFISGARRN